VNIHFVSLFMSAGSAPVNERVGGRTALDPDGLHHAAALLRSVARLDVHMLAPQARRAMVRISTSLDASSAMLADKVLDDFGEAHQMTVTVALCSTASPACAVHRSVNFCVPGVVEAFVPSCLLPSFPLAKAAVLVPTSSVI
jgi:hypothetical protein